MKYVYQKNCTMFIISINEWDSLLKLKKYQHLKIFVNLSAEKLILISIKISFTTLDTQILHVFTTWNSFFMMCHFFILYPLSIELNFFLITCMKSMYESHKPFYIARIYIVYLLIMFIILLTFSLNLHITNILMVHAIVSFSDFKLRKF
jgi:hypothetical protein